MRPLKPHSVHNLLLSLRSAAAKEQSKWSELWEDEMRLLHHMTYIIADFYYRYPLYLFHTREVFLGVCASLAFLAIRPAMQKNEPVLKLVSD